MAKGVRNFAMLLFALVLVASMLITGCTRYANEEQLTALDETEGAALEAERALAEKEKEKADLQAKLAEKQEELRKVQAEKEKIQSKLGQ